MAFGHAVLRLVLGGSDTREIEADSSANLADAIPASDLPGELLAPPPTGEAAEVERWAHGFADIEAAVELVASGISPRVVLSSFPTWPGLLWRAYELAKEADVLILPTVVRPGGRVDIVVTREKPNE